MAGKWGFIDRSGKIVVKPEFEKVEEFSEGLAVVLRNDKYGFIDKTGAVKIPFDLDFARGLINKVAVGSRDGYFPINRSGAKLAGDATFKGYMVSSDHLYPTHSTYRSAPDYDRSTKKFLVTKSGDYVFYNERTGDDVPFGFFDQEGTVVVKLDPNLRDQLLQISPFEDGVATVVVGDQAEPSSGGKRAPLKTFVCDKAGKLSKVNMDHIFEFHDRMARVQK